MGLFSVTEADLKELFVQQGSAYAKTIVEPMHSITQTPS
jgi:hypothetical protein